MVLARGVADADEGRRVGGAALLRRDSDHSVRRTAAAVHAAARGFALPGRILDQYLDESIPAWDILVPSPQTASETDH